MEQTSHNRGDVRGILEDASEELSWTHHGAISENHRGVLVKLT